MSIMNAGIFVRPRWADEAVDERFPFLMDYGYWTGAEVVDHAHNSGLAVHELTEERAIRSVLKDFLDYQDPVFFFHFSHGGPDTLTGQDMSVLVCCNTFQEDGLDLQPNHALLRDRVVYTLSCSSASELGPAAVQEGCIAYIGYKDLLWLTNIQGPDTDHAVFEIWVGGAKVLIDGGTTKDAYNFLKRRYKFWIEYWGMIDGSNTSDAWKAPVMLMVLEKNLKGLSLLGSLDARVREY